MIFIYTIAVLLIWNEDDMKLNHDLHQICIRNTFEPKDSL